MELLAVIAIISVLAAILIPTAGAVRVSANKTKTRVQFNQWAAAIEAFRNEYGYYPVFDSSHLVNGGESANTHPFHDLLAGRQRDGRALTDTGAISPAAQNRKRVAFYSFPESDFAGSGGSDLLADAFGNTEIAVVVDRNLDGLITSADASSSGWPLVGGLCPREDDLPTRGIRIGVIFYALAPDASLTNPKFIFSWK